ncbi:hypothetical protein BC835DRAFT_1524948 [Cytidiella melzeri]|nr:hypothetical protein BC835DRAFT_1524948 [Cytidiella melzeri]
MRDVGQEDLNDVDLALGIVRVVVRADAQVAVKMGVNGIDTWLTVLAILWQEGWAWDVLEKEVGGVLDPSWDLLSGWGSGVGELEEMVIGTQPNSMKSEEVTTGGWRNNKRTRVDDDDREDDDGERETTTREQLTMS